MKSRTCGLLTAFCTVWLLFVSFASAAAPIVSPEFIEGFRRVQGDRITFCLFSESPTSSFDRAVATEIADALLLQPGFYEVEQSVHIPLTDEEIYILLTDYCQAFMGFTLYPEGYDDWLTFSRPYYNTPYVLAVTDDRFDRQADIPREQAIGTRVLSLADMVLVSHLKVMKASDRWRRIPYPNDELLVERLLDRTIAGALLWGPALYEQTDGDPAGQGIRVIPADPALTLEWGIGIAFRSSDTFLRTTLDDAISALVQEGVIEELIEDSLLARPVGD